MTHRNSKFVLLAFALFACNRDAFDAGSPDGGPPPDMTTCPGGLEVIHTETFGASANIGVASVDGQNALTSFYSNARTCVVNQPLNGTGKLAGDLSACVPESEVRLYQLSSNPLTGGYWIEASDLANGAESYGFTPINADGTPGKEQYGSLVSSVPVATSKLFSRQTDDVIAHAYWTHSNTTNHDFQGEYNLMFHKQDEAFFTGGWGGVIDHEQDHTLGGFATIDLAAAYGVTFYETQQKLLKTTVRVFDYSSIYMKLQGEVVLATNQACPMPQPCPPAAVVKKIFVDGNVFVVWWQDLRSKAYLTTVDMTGKMQQQPKQLPSNVVDLIQAPGGGYGALVAEANGTSLKAIELDANLVEGRWAVVDQNISRLAPPHIVVMNDGTMLVSWLSTNADIGTVGAVRPCK